MRFVLMAAACVAVVSCASLSLEDLEFHAWKLKFGRVYKTPEEEAHRKAVWLSTRRMVLTHNILADQGIKSYRMGMNQFSDMEKEEYQRTLLQKSQILSNMTKNTIQHGTSNSRPRGGAKLPASMDWRKAGCVTPVKNQGSCGSCWAFSTTGSLESHTCIKYGRLPSLSEQQLVDCTRSYGNLGCNGGWMYNAFRYIQENNGIDTENSYPYEGKDGPCRFRTSDVGATCNGYVAVTPKGNEAALQEAVATTGPVTIAIDYHQSIQHYQSGVYNEPSCTSTQLLHAMLVVGYGQEDGLDFWLVKNSWGPEWGEGGYVKMSRNKGNQCDIASYAFYPEV